MNLRISDNVRGIASAALLTCLVAASVWLTQPGDKVDGTVPDDPGQQQISIPPRNYDSRSSISSRAAKPGLPVYSGPSEQYTQFTESTESTESTQSAQSTYSVQSTQSTGSTQSTQPTQSIQSTQSTQSTQSIQSTQSTQSTKPAKPTSDFVYTVKSGDTLSALAAAYGVTVKNIMAANGLDSDKLSLSQKLLIPASGKVKVIPPAPKTVKSAKQAQPVSKTTISRARVDGRPVGELIKWSEARSIFGIGAVATVTDVNTGYTFKIRRKGGHNHADCEPLTSDDTAIMKKVYGSWSWVRRAIIVEIKGKKIAASMAGMPHGSDDISGNGFAGHFDVHFLGSMTHGSEYTKSRVPQVDPDHQAMVRKAAGV